MPFSFAPINNFTSLPKIKGSIIFYYPVPNKTGYFNFLRINKKLE